MFAVLLASVSSFITFQDVNIAPYFFSNTPFKFTNGIFF